MTMRWRDLDWVERAYVLVTGGLLVMCFVGMAVAVVIALSATV